jgi:endonuclease-3
MKKLDTIRKVLDQEFPKPAVELHHSNPLELLIATILSAQCTDERVNRVTASLFKKYRKAIDYAEADPKLFEQEIRSTGFYKSKAKNIIRCCQALVQRFGGQVPKTMEELTTLPGVWRKTASVILGNCFGQPAIVVDTHVLRVSRRLGLTRSEDPDEVERDLAKLLPESSWTRVSHQLLLHGRYICKAKKPDCPSCGMKSVCAFYSSQSPSKAV